MTSIKKKLQNFYTHFSMKKILSSIFMINFLFTDSQLLPFKIIILSAQFIFSCFEQHINGVLTLPVVFSIVLDEETTDVVFVMMIDQNGHAVYLMLDLCLSFLPTILVGLNSSGFCIVCTVVRRSLRFIKSPRLACTV